MDLDRLRVLAGLVREQNAVHDRISALVGRPAQIGHVGEFIASEVFDIALQDSAVAAGLDGSFRSGPLAGRSVNIKWYGKREGALDVALDAPPDFYLVLCGPRTADGSSRGGTRPWLIEEVFLFEHAPLLTALQGRRVKIGVATSVAKEFWERARVFPAGSNAPLALSPEQVEALAMFGSAE